MSTEVKTDVRVQVNVTMPPPTIVGKVPIPNPNINLYELAYQKFRQLVEGKSYGVANMIVLVGIAVQVAQQLQRGSDKLNGAEKKAIVINIVRRWIGDSPSFSAEDRTYLCDVFVPVVLDGVIDGLCALDVNAVSQKATVGCLRWCCGSDVIRDVDVKPKDGVCVPAEIRNETVDHAYLGHMKEPEPPKVSVTNVDVDVNVVNTV